MNHRVDFMNLQVHCIHLFFLIPVWQVFFKTLGADLFNQNTVALIYTVYNQNIYCTPLPFGSIYYSLNQIMFLSGISSTFRSDRAFAESESNSRAAANAPNIAIKENQNGRRLHFRFATLVTLRLTLLTSRSYANHVQCVDESDCGIAWVGLEVAHLKEQYNINIWKDVTYSSSVEF